MNEPRGESAGSRSIRPLWLRAGVVAIVVAAGVSGAAPTDDRLPPALRTTSLVVTPAVTTDEPEQPQLGAEREPQRRFNHRPVRAVKTIEMRVTGYSPDERSCGKFADGITASGYSVWTNGMRLAAADTDLLPFGTLISVPGYHAGGVIPVLDRGGAIKGKRLDVLFATHERALQWGVRTLQVTVWEYADGEPDDYVPR